MYTGHQRNMAVNRQGNGGAGNNNHQPGNKSRLVGNNGGPTGVGGGFNSRYIAGAGNNNNNNSSSNNSNPNHTSSSGINQSPNTPGLGFNSKSRIHGRESSNSGLSNDGPPPSNQNTGHRNGMVLGMDKRNGSMTSPGQGPVKAEVTNVTHKDNLSPYDDGDKKLNPAGDCDPNSMVKPFTHNYTNSSRYNSRGGNWSRGGRGGGGGGKGRGYNNNRGFANRSIIQYPSGYYSTIGGGPLPMDNLGQYNFIPVAPVPLGSYFCCDPNCQECQQPCYPNGMMPQYYTLPAFQYVPYPLGSPGVPPIPTMASAGPGSHGNYFMETLCLSPTPSTTASYSSTESSSGSFDLPLNPPGKYLALGDSDIVTVGPPQSLANATAAGIYSTLPPPPHLSNQSQAPPPPLAQSSSQDETCRPGNESDQINQGFKDNNNNPLVPVNREIMPNHYNRTHPAQGDTINHGVPYNSLGGAFNSNYWIPVPGGYPMPRPMAPAPPNFFLEHNPEAESSLTFPSPLMLINPNPQTMGLPQQPPQQPQPQQQQPPPRQAQQEPYRIVGKI